MKIIFVRHGNPNYELDCLTELGHIQAESAAKRLSLCGIERIYSSSCGRARETAMHTARRLGLDVTLCDFMREIDWSPIDRSLPAAEGNPWARANMIVEKGDSLVDPDWCEIESYKSTKTPESRARLAEGFDLWLKELGYEREGCSYRVGKVKYHTVAMFSHAGAFSAALSYFMDLPMPFVLHSIPMPQTGIVEITLSESEGVLCAPVLHRIRGAEHLHEDKIKITG